MPYFTLQEKCKYVFIIAMKTTKKPAFILFDLDNTLYPASSSIQNFFDEQIVAYTARYLKITPQEADIRRSEGFKKYGTSLAWLQAEHNFTEIEEYLEAIHAKDIDKHIDQVPALRELLKSIPQPKGILTNSIREHALRVIQHLGIEDCFEFIIDIRDCNFLNKPAVTAYEKALARINYPVEEVLFIDDNPKFLPPFQKLGGQVLLIDEKGTYAGEDFPAIQSILELGEFLSL